MVCPGDRKMKNTGKGKMQSCCSVPASSAKKGLVSGRTNRQTTVDVCSRQPASHPYRSLLLCASAHQVKPFVPPACCPSRLFASSSS